MIEVPTTVSAGAPTGSPFIVDRSPFKFGEPLDTGMLDLAEDRVLNWPMVYILANDTEAYVGQTTSVATRISQHGANVEKKDFDTVNIIYNEEFNGSVITDYEHRLIGLMHADGRYRLTNKNEGMTSTNYFSKAEYALMFEELWEELQKMELVEHSISDLEETEVFKYSPFKGLTPDQHVALERIMAAIRQGFDAQAPIVVEGMPGTGKTVLAIFLLKALRDNPEYKDLNIRIIEPVTSLRKTLQASLKNVAGLSPRDIISPTDLVKASCGYRRGDKGFDILLVDESHKLKRRVNLGTQFGNYDAVNKELGLGKDASQLDWVLDQAKLPILFYDPLQSIGPSCLGHGVMSRALGSALDDPITLDSQMRVKGGADYLHYIKRLLQMGADTCAYAPNAEYDYVLHDSFVDFVASFERDLAAHSLTRMVAGYAWKWVSKADADAYDISFDGIDLKWNCTYENWVGRGMENPGIAHEVGCIHSIQGYDLSYAYVIVGNDLRLDPNTGILHANRDNYLALLDHRLHGSF